MVITVTGRHLDITDDVKTYITKKIEHFSKYTAKLIDTKVIVESVRGIYKVEIVLLAGRASYYGDSEDAEMRTAIDKAIKKMDAQLRNHKEKVKERHRKAKLTGTTLEETAEEVDEIIDEDYIE